MLMINRIHRVPVFASMQRELNDLFNTISSDSGPSRSTGPAMNVWEDDSRYFIEAELPGFRMEDIDVSVLGDEVTVHGQRTMRDRDGAAYLRRERREGTESFSRSFNMPRAIDTANVVAELNDGVLLITLPKTPEVQPRKIAVKSGK
jgi:HSP20 family protein